MDDYFFTGQSNYSRERGIYYSTIQDLFLSTRLEFLVPVNYMYMYYMYVGRTDTGETFGALELDPSYADLSNEVMKYSIYVARSLDHSPPSTFHLPPST